MKLLNTYDDKETAEHACSMISGVKRLASERDGTQTIYNLFGTPTWGNFYRLDMFNLKQLENLLSQRDTGLPYDQNQHRQIINQLRYVESSFELKIPERWNL
ncbi:hypothetical protein [Rheinheimera sp.]|uniref:hypothetical protein n=1 Tax=Rheinheimera sp. TaxID=1869214 RepID=UPI0027370B95|nr:hypothetical protein [Rheinheimera sp.]MDP2716487.1 hypothetical protein [Rheinheimera sp.]